MIQIWALDSDMLDGVVFWSPLCYTGFGWIWILRLYLLRIWESDFEIKQAMTV